MRDTCLLNMARYRCNSSGTVYVFIYPSYLCVRMPHVGRVQYTSLPNKKIYRLWLLTHTCLATFAVCIESRWRSSRLLWKWFQYMQPHKCYCGLWIEFATRGSVFATMISKLHLSHWSCLKQSICQWRLFDQKLQFVVEKCKRLLFLVLGTNRRTFLTNK